MKKRSTTRVTIRPPFGARAKAASSALSRRHRAVDRGQLHAKRRSHGLDCGELADSEDIGGSRRTATRVTRGAICLSSSSHFPLMPNSKVVKPVALPPGRARLSTKPAPTGSVTLVKRSARYGLPVAMAPRPHRQWPA